MKTYTRKEVISLLEQLLREHNACLPDVYSMMDKAERAEYLKEFIKQNLKK